jgi:DNA replication protein DnaC
MPQINIEDLIRQWLPLLIMNGKINSQWAILVVPVTLYIYNFLLELYQSYQRPKDLVSVKISHEKWSWYGMPHTMKAICWYIREVVKAQNCTYKLEAEKDLHKRDDRVKKILPIFTLESCPEAGIDIIYNPVIACEKRANSSSANNNYNYDYLSNGFERDLERGVQNKRLEPRGEKVNVKLHRIMKEETFQRLDIIVTAEKEEYVMNFINGVSEEYFKYLEFKASETKDKCVYTHSGENKWIASCPLLNKTFENVFLDQNIRDTLIHDLNTFSSSEEYYKKIGLPYKRGYLLHGPPGTGKSSTYYAIANHTNRDLYKMSLASLSADGFKTLVGGIPPNSVLAIDDVDRVESTNKVEESNLSSDKSEDNSIIIKKDKDTLGKDALGKLLNINISTFLEVFDGYDFLNNVIVVFTSNHPEKLDPALIRPGRADVSLNIDYPNHDTLMRIFRYFFPHETVCIPSGIKNKSPAEIITRIILPNRADYLQCLNLLTDSNFLIKRRWMFCTLPRHRYPQT